MWIHRRKVLNSLCSHSCIVPFKIHLFIKFYEPQNVNKLAAFAHLPMPGFVEQSPYLFSPWIQLTYLCNNPLIYCLPGYNLFVEQSPYLLSPWIQLIRGTIPLSHISLYTTYLWNNPFISYLPGHNLFVEQSPYLLSPLASTYSWNNPFISYLPRYNLFVE